MPAPSTPSTASLDLEGKGDYSTAVVQEAPGYEIDAAAEKRLVRKLDLRIMPCLALAYLVTSLDRSNAGNAKVAGLTTDLGLIGNDFNIATCLFYVGHILFDVPSGIAVRKWGFRFVPATIVGFGILTLGFGFLKNRGEFIALRCLLGIAESAVLPGNAAILARYYKRSEITTRVGFFLFTAAYLSGAFGGLLASKFITLKAMGPVHTWRHIFVWEGVITIAVGILLLFLYPTDPATTHILNEDERALALGRLSAGQIDGSSASRDDTVGFAEACKIIAHPQVLAAIVFFIFNNVTVQGLNSFLPTVIKLNYPGASAVRIQLLSVPPNVFAWGWATLMAWVAMRYRQHAYVAMLGGLFSVIGYAMWVATDATFIKIRYSAIFLCQGSGYYGPLIMAWAMSNAKNDKSRALTGAAVSGLGSIGSVISPWTYLASTAASGYKPGNSLNLALSTAVVVGCFAWRMVLMRLNKRAAAKEGDFRYIY